MKQRKCDECGKVADEEASEAEGPRSWGSASVWVEVRAEPACGSGRMSWTQREGGGYRYYRFEGGDVCSVACLKKWAAELPDDEVSGGAQPS